MFRDRPLRNFIYTSGENVLAVYGESDAAQTVRVLKYGDGSPIREPPEADMILYNRCNNGAITVYGEDGMAGVDFPIADLRPGR